MATELSSLSQTSITTKDEFEGLEVTEFDANALWELLYDEPVEDEVESRGGGAPMQAMEVVIEPNLDLRDESYSPLDDINNEDVQYLNWLRVMEETYAPCNDVGGWFGGACMEEMMNVSVEMGDYSLSHSAIMNDEIGYIGLWQDN